VKETVASQIIAILQRQGVEHIFGIPSGYFIPYMDAMRSRGMEFVLVANEASAGFMATVYAWLKKVPGVCYATIGPGATNLSTGVGGALLDKAPVIAFTSEPSDAYNHRTIQMAIDQQALFKPLVKWTTRLHPSAIDHVFHKALHVALSEQPGPVHIGLPDETEHVLVTKTDFPRIQKAHVASSDQHSLNTMQKLFQKATLPVLAVGLTAVRLGLGAMIKELAEKHNIPVVLTPMAKGILSEDHPSYAGVLFHALSDTVAQTYNQADMVIGVGYDPVEFNYESWIPKAQLIHIDTVPVDIDTDYVSGVLSVVGDPAAALTVLKECEQIKSGWDMEAVRKRTDAMFAAFKPKEGSFGPLAVIEDLRNALPDDGIMSCDVGSHTHLIGQAWRTPDIYTQIMTNGWSSMGFGVPAAIGAKIACPDKAVACITGDGGFMMMVGEMATAKRLNKNIVFVVLVDHSLELIKLKQAQKNVAPYGVELTDEKESAHRSFFGVPVMEARTRPAFQKALAFAFAQEGPVVIEAYIDPSEYKDLILRKHR